MARRSIIWAVVNTIIAAKKSINLRIPWITAIYHIIIRVVAIKMAVSCRRSIEMKVRRLN